MTIEQQNPPLLAKILPITIRTRLVELAIKAEVASQTASRGRDSAAYRAVIREIDDLRERARSLRPHLFRYPADDMLDAAPQRRCAAPERSNA